MLKSKISLSPSGRVFAAFSRETYLSLKEASPQGLAILADAELIEALPGLDNLVFAVQRETPHALLFLRTAVRVARSNSVRVAAQIAAAPDGPQRAVEFRTRWVRFFGFVATHPGWTNGFKPSQTAVESVGLLLEAFTWGLEAPQVSKPAATPAAVEPTPAAPAAVEPAPQPAPAPSPGAKTAAPAAVRPRKRGK